MEKMVKIVSGKNAKKKRKIFDIIVKRRGKSLFLGFFGYFTLVFVNYAII